MPEAPFWTNGWVGPQWSSGAYRRVYARRWLVAIASLTLVGVVTNGLVQSAEAASDIQSSVQNAVGRYYGGVHQFVGTKGPRVVDLPLGGFPNTSSVPVTVTAVRPVLSGPHVRWAGDFLVALCHYDYALPVVEPGPHASAAERRLYFAPADVVRPHAQRLEPDNMMRTAFVRGCASNPRYGWVVRIQEVGRGSAMVRGFDVTLHALHNTFHELVGEDVKLVIR